MSSNPPSKEECRVHKRKYTKKHPNRIAHNFLEYAYNLDYKERPATMEELLCSNKFFGSLTDKGKFVYPLWMKVLEDLRLEDSKYIVVFTGATSIGKSRAAVWEILFNQSLTTL